LLVALTAAALVSSAARPARGEEVAVRGAEIVAREGPDPSQPGVAVLRGDQRVRLVGRRGAWSEILLEDGRRAWVPSADIAAVAPAGAAAPEGTPVAPAERTRPAPPPAEALSDTAPGGVAPQRERMRPAPPPAGAPAAGDGPRAAAEERTGEAPPAEATAAADGAALRELRLEVGRLRAAVDELAALARRQQRADSGGDDWLRADALAALGVALLLGLAAGSAFQRYRSRRDRSLRF
jgi:hypothetical protein